MRSSQTFVEPAVCRRERYKSAYYGVHVRVCSSQAASDSGTSAGLEITSVGLKRDPKQGQTEQRANVAAIMRRAATARESNGVRAHEMVMEIRVESRRTTHPPNPTRGRSCGSHSDGFRTNGQTAAVVACAAL